MTFQALAICQSESKNKFIGPCVVYSYFEKVVGKNVHATIPKGNMG